MRFSGVGTRIPPCRLATLLATALLFLAAACDGEGDLPVVTAVDSAGVDLLVLPGQDSPLAWTPERQLEIRPVEEDTGGFFGVTDVTVVDGSRIAVLDQLGLQVVLFDEGGRFLTQYGREGSGPGEFKLPTTLAATPWGGVLVFDFMNRRLERFDSTLVPMAPVPVQVSFSGGHVGYVDDFLIFPARDIEVQEASVQFITAMNETDTVEVVRYVREVGGMVTLESCGMMFQGIPPLFSPTTRWAQGVEGEMVVVGTSRYELDIYGAPDFSLRRRIRRQVPPVQSTQEMAEAEVGDGMRVLTPAGERVCDAAEVAEQRGFASQVPPVTRVAVSPSGEIWVRRWAPGDEEGEVDVLGPDGAYLGTLPAGFPFPDAFLGPDRLVVREEDELELTSVVVYRIRRG